MILSFAVLKIKCWAQTAIAYTQNQTYNHLFTYFTLNFVQFWLIFGWGFTATHPEVLLPPRYTPRTPSFLYFTTCLPVLPFDFPLTFISRAPGFHWGGGGGVQGKLSPKTSSFPPKIYKIGRKDINMIIKLTSSPKMKPISLNPYLYHCHWYHVSSSAFSSLWSIPPLHTSQTKPLSHSLSPHPQNHSHPTYSFVDHHVLDCFIWHTRGYFSKCWQWTGFLVSMVVGLFFFFFLFF